MKISRKEFVEAIFKQHLTEYNGYIETREFIPNKPPKQIFHKTIDEIVQYVPEGNFYFGVCPRSKMSGKSEDVEMITVLWVDIDAKGQTKEEIIERLKKFKYPPTFIVDSGNGIHAYWLLKQPEPIHENTKGILKGLARALKGDEHCHDLARILRVPDTLNVKDPANPKEVKVISFNPDVRYELSEFDHFCVPVNDTKTDKVVFSDDVKRIDINKLCLSNDTKALILNGKRDGDGYGSRSEADFRVVCDMIDHGYSDDEIKAVFSQFPIGDKYRERGDPYLICTIANGRAKIQKESEESDPSDKVNSVKIAKQILQEHRLINCVDDFYEYADGYYRLTHEKVVRKWAANLLGSKAGMNKIKDILYYLESQVHVDAEAINDARYLNLKNGLFEIDNHGLLQHNPDVHSTIRLDVNYDPNAKCEVWLRTLNEIFEGNKSKIDLLQEFCGLCLTKEVKYEKALMLVGEGANGKSTILYILERLLGLKNCSAVPLEKFDNSHYLASLFNKLVNICSETNAKSGVYDSSFKKIISGDTVQADYKFKNPFLFKPYCKLIFAVNALPWVEDKSDAYFRRLLILRFNKEFKEAEQNKNLKYELVNEIDGIFLWCLDGLKRLRSRGYFGLCEEMKNEIGEYRKENNSVLQFVGEICKLDPTLKVGKDELYQVYKIWCGENTYSALGKIKFGKELVRHYKLNKNDRVSGGDRVWNGIGFCEVKNKTDKGVDLKTWKKKLDELKGSKMEEEELKKGLQSTLHDIFGITLV